jgi:cytochrome c biogenesis protein CcdA
VDLLTYVTAFSTGLATSIGPCAAPRYLALAALAAHPNAKTRRVRASWFILGIICCYAVLFCVTSWASSLQGISHIVYASLAAVFFLCGVNRTLVRTSCVHEHDRSVSKGWLWLLGACLGLVFSPCCSPLLAVAGGLGAAATIQVSLGGVVAFLAGHLLPLAVIAIAGSVGVRSPLLPQIKPALGTIGAGLMMALGLYYGLLA